MRKYFSNEQILQDYGVLFKNAETQNELKTQLAEYGYDEAEMKKGKALYDKAEALYQENAQKKQKEMLAYAQFSAELENLLAGYKTDRKKVKIIYKDQPEILVGLRLKGQNSRAMAKLLEEVHLLYRTLKNDEALRTPLQRLKVTEESIEAQLTQLAKTEKAYAAYIQEKGESQDATKQKDAAFSTLEKWVQEFYSIAKIALEERPQLLESLGKVVKS